MKDILDRLIEAGDDAVVPGLYAEAAAEIERLRATSHWFRAKKPLGIPMQNDRKALSPYSLRPKKGMTLSERLKAQTVEDENGCWIWQGSCYSGYGRIRRPPKGRSLMCHRLMYEEQHGILPKELCVMHLCDNRRCINPAHLQAGTHTENMVDKSRKGRSTALLTPDQVLEIRRRKSEGEGIYKLADAFGVCHGTITAICTRKTWKWLDEEQPSVRI